MSNLSPHAHVQQVQPSQVFESPSVNHCCVNDYETQLPIFNSHHDTIAAPVKYHQPFAEPATMPYLPSTGGMHYGSARNSRYEPCNHGQQTQLQISKSMKE